MHVCQERTHIRGESDVSDSLHDCTDTLQCNEFTETFGAAERASPCSGNPEFEFRRKGPPSWLNSVRDIPREKYWGGALRK